MSYCPLKIPLWLGKLPVNRSFESYFNVKSPLLMNTFLILDTPPENSSLATEPNADALSAVITDDVILLKRNDTGDRTVLARRLQQITLEASEMTLRSVHGKRAERFGELAKSGDRLIVICEEHWTQHIVL